VRAFSNDDLVTVYLGLTSYVAEKRGKQTHGGAMMSEHTNHADTEGFSTANHYGHRLVNVINMSDEIEHENSVTEMVGLLCRVQGS